MKDKDDFQELTEQRAKESFLREFYLMLMHNKKWWLTPIILIMLLFGALIIVGGSSYAPFIYTLF